MKSKPYVNQKVRLNPYGLYQIYGTVAGLSPLLQKVFTITSVDSKSMTIDVGTWMVGVDDVEISQFFIDNHCFDEVENG